MPYQYQTQNQNICSRLKIQKQGMQNNNNKSYLTSSGTVQRNFQMAQVMIKVHHSVQITQLKPEYQAQETKPIQINNHLPVLIDNLITKIVQIVLKDRIITIKEVFNLDLTKKGQQSKMQKQESLKEQKSQSGQKISCDNKNFNQVSRRKIYIMKRNTHIPQLSNKHRRDTKNIVRNILSMFQKWSAQNKQQIQMHDQNLFQSLKKFTSGVHFNNTLIYKIAQRQKVCQIFFQFLKQQFQGYLQKSKIIDKKSYLEARDRYIIILKGAKAKEVKKQQYIMG